VWFTPFSLELTFSRMFEHVAAFIRCIVLPFTHWVNTPTFNSATCFTLAATQYKKYGQSVSNIKTRSLYLTLLLVQHTCGVQLSSAFPNGNQDKDNMLVLPSLSLTTVVTLLQTYHTHNKKSGKFTQLWWYHLYFSIPFAFLDLSIMFWTVLANIWRDMYYLRMAEWSRNM
jgi:hypothetical protein